MIVIVHLGTKIQSLFGLVDAEENVVKQFPLTADLAKVGPAELAEIGAKILAQKKELEAQHLPLVPDVPRSDQ
jgi:hypothetical protein